MQECKVVPNFVSVENCANLLKNIFDRSSLWESRQERKVNYRNGDWFTVGSAVYLDLKSEDHFPEYLEKVFYWQQIMDTPIFSMYLDAFREKFESIYNEETKGMKCKVKFLAECRTEGALRPLPAGYPGFHIFPGIDNLTAFFGKKHKDHQYEALFQIPEIKKYFEGKEVHDHFSITIPFVLPLRGGGMLMGENLETYYPYEVGALYLHTGDFFHAIAPFLSPVLPCDFRITLQAHGFHVEDTIYLYW